MRETNIETPKRNQVIDDNCIPISTDAANTTPTTSHIYQTYNRQQILKRKKENQLNNENIKRKRYCGLSKHFNKESPKQQLSPLSPMLILNNEEINIKTDSNTNEIVNNINKLENNTNKPEDLVIKNLKSSIRIWTNGFKKALEILEKKYESQEDTESILKKCNITINLSDYENI